jgi:hypothetical protein
LRQRTQLDSSGIKDASVSMNSPDASLSKLTIKSTRLKMNAISNRPISFGMTKAHAILPTQKFGGFKQEIPSSFGMIKPMLC